MKATRTNRSAIVGAVAMLAGALAPAPSFAQCGGGGYYGGGGHYGGHAYYGGGGYYGAGYGGGSYYNSRPRVIYGSTGHYAPRVVHRTAYYYRPTLTYRSHSVSAGFGYRRPYGHYTYGSSYGRRDYRNHGYRGSGGGHRSSGGHH